MVVSLLRKIFGTRNERLIRSMYTLVHKINALEPEYQKLSNEALQAKTEEFKKRYQAGETLNSLMTEAFAAVREASVRTLGLRHFDVQLIGAMALHDGKIAEMRMGEGKTLVGTMPAYLNALTGKGVHIVTVNDYLAKRDAEWMGPIYEFLGLSVGVNLTGMRFDMKKKAYASDITYGTNNEFGFDYLRDNMAFYPEGRVQRPLHYAIVDEVDCILIDEARTPLIISGPTEGGSEMYVRINKLIPKLIRQVDKDGPGDYSADEKTRQAFLTEAGHKHVETLLIEEGLIDKDSSLYDSRNISLMHHINAALRAHALYHADIEYMVKDGEVVIVDEHTGRLMSGRRWSDGLHQAIEAKENVEIKSENQTLAMISFQNYFRLYEKLSGMTGTADTEAYEFQQIYGLEVLVIPTNQPVIREDKSDLVYLSAAAKYKAIVKDIKARREKGQPILVGTTSIDSSELLSKMLKKEHITHEVLNAKYHEKEAHIIAEAGRPGAITIATNMAGRGTDIVLGGNIESEIAQLENPTPEEIAKRRQDWQKRHDAVIAAGGLHVLGTERNESRRIDNQLRGRSGRQGDPGSSQYYLSLEDNLMRIFASDRMQSFMQKIGMEEDVPIENGLVTKSIANAQRKVEGHNFDVRKQLLQFDDVANDQRKVIYAQRNELFESQDISESIQHVREDAINSVISEYIPLESLVDQWDVPGLEAILAQKYNLKLNIQQWLDEDEKLYEEALRQKIIQAANESYHQKEQRLGPIVMRQLEKSIMLQSIDSHWREHLQGMEYLRQGIHLRGYAQKNPVQEYKREAFEMFKEMLDAIKRDVISVLCTIEIDVNQPTPLLGRLDPSQINPFASDKLQMQHAAVASVADMPVLAGDMEEEPGSVETFVRDQPKVGRNDPCPCGSEKKFKQCHGKV